jgi:glycosyltransferase involved in cell wall biosynthesis
MRILFVNSGLGVGGAERQVVLLSRELVRHGHAASIFTLNCDLARADELRGSGVNVIADQKRWRLDPYVLYRLRAHIRAWQPDVVHGFLYDGNLYSRLATAGMGVLVLGSERSDNYVLSSSQRLGYWLTRRLSQGVVANSHSGAAFAQRLHGLSAAQVHVVWNGIDLGEVDARLARSTDAAGAIWPGDGLLRACMVGAIKPAKDYPLALRVMRQLVDRDARWRFVCVGDELHGAQSNERAAVVAESERLGLAPYVRFVGRRGDVLEIMHSSDALLITSTHEGFPNVVLEAMACGTPVASTQYSDVSRILPRPWQVVPSRDASALADALTRCVSERTDVVPAQRRWVESHATMAASAASLLRVYGQCLTTDGQAVEPAL